MVLLYNKEEKYTINFPQKMTFLSGFLGKKQRNYKAVIKKQGKTTKKGRVKVILVNR